MKRTVLALLACSCAWPRGFLFIDTPYPVAFTTKCGVKVLGPLRDEPPLPAGWTLEAVQDVEDRALKAFAHLAPEDVRFTESCERLKGWDVMVSQHKNIGTRTGELAGGDTDCNAARIFIGSSAPDRGRLAHEFAHAIQGCRAGTDGEVHWDQHHQWGSIYGALREAGLPE